MQPWSAVARYRVVLAKLASPGTVIVLRMAASRDQLVRSTAETTEDSARAGRAGARAPGCRVLRADRSRTPPAPSDPTMRRKSPACCRYPSRHEAAATA